MSNSLKRIQRTASLFGRSSSRTLVDEEIPEDPEFQRHLDGEHGDMHAALKRWKKTLKWRSENAVDGILDRPYPRFDVVKRYYPHYYCGRTKAGRLLYIERLTEVDLKSLRELGFTVDDLVNHYIFLAEYQVKYLAKDAPDGKSVTILDVHGLRFSQIIGETVSFAKRVAKIAQDHYPERAHKIFVVNVPLWFSSVFQIIKPLLSAETLAKIKIYRSNYRTALLKDIDEQVLPARYGGQNKRPDYENPDEIELREFVMKRLDETNMKMSYKDES